MIIGFTGLPEVGKSTFIKALERHCPGSVKSAHIGRMIHLFTDALAEELGIPEDEVPSKNKNYTIEGLQSTTPRRIMQRAAKFLNREDIVVTMVHGLIAGNTDSDHILLDGFRSEEQIQALKSWGGILVEVIRPDANEVADPLNQEYVSKGEADVVIANVGTLEELDQHAKDFWETAEWF